VSELTVIEDLGEVPPPAHDVVTFARRALSNEIAATIPGDGRRGGSRLGRVLAAASVMVAVGGLSLGAYRLSMSSPTTNTTIECGADTFIPVQTGDPLADCAATMARSGSSVPPLEAWASPSGLVVVLPENQSPPAGSTRLPSTFRVDTAVRFLTDSLSDEVGPLASACLVPSAATSVVDHAFHLTGLVGWSVAITPAPAPSNGGCADYAAVVDPGTRRVNLMQGWSTASSMSSSSGADMRLDQLLAAQIGGGPGSRCVSVPGAMALANADAHALGISNDALSVSDGGSLAGAGTTCAHAYVDPAGFVGVIVWAIPSSS
jgi:hypothetical protein